MILKIIRFKRFTWISDDLDNSTQIILDLHPSFLDRIVLFDFFSSFRFQPLSVISILSSSNAWFELKLSPLQYLITINFTHNRSSSSFQLSFLVYRSMSFFGCFPEMIYPINYFDSIKSVFYHWIVMINEITFPSESKTTSKDIARNSTQY